MSVPKPLKVTQIGEYIRHHSCERRFKLDTDETLVRKLPFFGRLLNPLDPVLQAEGKKREDEWEKSLKDCAIVETIQANQQSADQHTNQLNGHRASTPYDDSSVLTDDTQVTEWDTFIESCRDLTPGQNAYSREVQVTAELEAFQLTGKIDFVVVLWQGEQPKLRLVECKASRRDRTYHRVQVALYQMLVQKLVQTSPMIFGGVTLRPEDVECVVARLDESTNEIQAILELEPLNLDREEADVRRLLSPKGSLNRIIKSDLSDLDYQLDAKCDGCVFNVHCLTESARLRRLELIAIEPSTVRALCEVGISTIDDLADLDLKGSQATEIRKNPNFSDNLEILHYKAKARRRTLPGGDLLDPESHEVQGFPFAYTVQSQLPKHQIDDHRLVRIYLCVDYDYVENRIGALSAHVTSSDRLLHTDRPEVNGSKHFDPEVKERWETGRDENNKRLFEQAPLRKEYSKEVVEFIRQRWTGRYEIDTGIERQLLQNFLCELVETIATVAQSDEVPIHFYVWSRQEMAHLVEACSRVGSELLGHLRELLGCRESLDQLIYSCLDDEVDRRYALGWTGKGLAVATSLWWFGWKYHWFRRINRETVALDLAFTQNIFDFKTTLNLRRNPTSDDEWSTPDDQNSSKYLFEIRSRFHDSLPAPYWRAYWGTLPDPEQTRDQRLANAIRRYNEANKMGYLKAYLCARTQALRWIEERIDRKNQDLTKPLMPIDKLPNFALAYDTRRVAIDFLWLDQHVKFTDWLSDHLIPPLYRAPLGRTIPLRDVVLSGRDRLTATINLDGYDIDYVALAANCTIAEDSFVRLTLYSDDPHRGQTVGQLLRAGSTCIVKQIDWRSRRVELEVQPLFQADRYRLQSIPPRETLLYATIDESPSDPVAVRVDGRLQSGSDSQVYQWFNPEKPRISPQVSPSTEQLEQYRQLLKSFSLPNGQSLEQDQVEAAVNGLCAKVQLLQGPPGTGKTTTTAAAALLRILARRSVGNIVLVTAHTHKAVNILLQRIDRLLPAFDQQATESGLRMPSIRLAKVQSSPDQPQPGGGVRLLPTKSCFRLIQRERVGSVLVIGGTTSAILAMTKELNKAKTFANQSHGFQVPMLIVDEASMMVFPHFLALATLVIADGEIMLAGDHRQLAPIVAHNWEREERPPIVVYQPFVSAYSAIDNIKKHSKVVVPDTAVRQSALQFTFRLPPVIRELISRLYQRDNIQLQGRPWNPSELQITEVAGTWEKAIKGFTGLYLVLHNERKSKKYNELEVQVIEHILEAAGEATPKSIAVLTPHRAQRTLLKTRLAPYTELVGDIDTVERLQGDERPTIIVSGTASDPAAISKNVEFILDLNRSNVAFSRTLERLIVVCSETLINHIPTELEHYDNTMLWKDLRKLCSQLIATENVDGHEVQIFTPSPSDILKAVSSIMEE